MVDGFGLFCSECSLRVTQFKHFFHGKMRVLDDFLDRLIVGKHIVGNRSTLIVKCFFLFDVKFVIMVAHTHCLAYKKFFSKITQFCLFLQLAEMRAFGHKNRAFAVDAVKYTQPLRETTIVRRVLDLQELGDFDKGDGLLVVEDFVFVVPEPEAMAVIGRIGVPVEHLEADKVQVAEVIVIALDAACNHVLRGVVNQAALERVVIDMLHFEHDAVLTLIQCHDVRSDAFRERVREGWVNESEVFDAVAAVELEHRVEQIDGERLVFASPEKQLKDVVVVDIDIIVNFSVLCNAGVDTASGLARFRNVLEHFCVLFLVHKEPFAAMGEAA